MYTMTDQLYMYDVSLYIKWYTPGLSKSRVCAQRKNSIVVNIK